MNKLLVGLCLVAMALSLPVDLKGPSVEIYREWTSDVIASGIKTPNLMKRVMSAVPAPVVSGLSAIAKGVKDADLLARAAGVRQALDGSVSEHDLLVWSMLYDMSREFPSIDKEGIIDPSVFQDVMTEVELSNGESFQVPIGYLGMDQSVLMLVLQTEHGYNGYTTMLQDTIKALHSLDQVPHLKPQNDSHCTQTSSMIECEFHFDRIPIGTWPRNVCWQTPVGTPPANGWPVVLMFQGTFFSPHVFSWAAPKWFPFGAYYQTEVIKVLLDNGFAVITPETHLQGFTFWDTNIPPFNVLWETASDHRFMLALFAEIDRKNGMFGDLDINHMFATGISSGGYMTSRMAVSYPEYFRALSVAAGSYAWCAGPICPIPPLKDNHPPTMFVHGNQDFVVPISTMEDYESALSRMGKPTRKVIHPTAGHEWFENCGEETLKWFTQHFNATSV